MARVNEYIRYQPDERCPPFLSISVAFQGVVIAMANMVLFVTVAVRAGNQSDDYLLWAIFSALIIGGVITALQAGRVGKLGTGHVLMTGAGPHFIAVSVLAMTKGDLPMLASLIVISSLVQFALAKWLPLLRRVITPVVSGIALMLIAVTAMTIAVDRISEVPEGVQSTAGPAVAATTLVVATMLAMRASGIWRLWAPLIGIASGCAVAVLLGMYDLQRVIDAQWLHIPDITAWPGLDLRPSVEFWTLLPVFLIVSLVSSVKMSSDGVVIQRISRVRPQATDFRLVQAAVNTNGLGVLLSGIAGTLPPVIYTPSVVTLINLTGVAARSVGYAIGAILIVLAFLPKATAVLLTIPSPVMGAFLLMIMGLLFVEGMRMVFQGGLDHRKALVVGVALSIGVGLESQNILTDVLGQTWGILLGNGMTAGVLAAILMTLFIELTSPRHTRLETTLDISALSRIDRFLCELASKLKWNDTSTERLRAAGEETVSSLLQSRGDHEADSVPRLIIVARPGETVELEFLAVFDEENIEDRLAHLSEQAQVPEEHEISFWLLRHYASSVHHRKYHGLDIVSVHVEGSR
ncbi:MAG: hypothetical protein OXI96_09925 [Acidimicrobiaceae bacterium]|nr:hypothetical protein [Acidimicrobiaceae bacterium]